MTNIINMRIPWTYLNKRQATCVVLRDHKDMKFIIDNTERRIQEIHSDMVAVHSPSWDGMPKSHNNDAHEQKVINGITEIDVLQERYRQAQEYMAWFQPAWDQLAEDERFVLQEFFMSDEQEQACARYTIADQFHIDPSSAYRKRDRAVAHLALLLYGRN